MTDHYMEAQRLLAEAAELDETPRHSVAKTKATMAQAHATLALVKAVRQAANPADAPVQLVEVRHG